MQIGGHALKFCFLLVRTLEVCYVQTSENKEQKITEEKLKEN
jgi:hypothetical protein